ncbi:MAG: hypothetical protein ACTHNW_08490 [Mucilaginibacter sp.]
MNLLFKILFYVIVMVVLTVASLTLFKNHPEVELAFFIPGVFILVYSVIRDQVYVSTLTRLRIARGK